VLVALTPLTRLCNLRQTISWLWYHPGFLSYNKQVRRKIIVHRFWRSLSLDSYPTKSYKHWFTNICNLRILHFCCLTPGSNRACSGGSLTRAGAPSEAPGTNGATRARPAPSATRRHRRPVRARSSNKVVVFKQCCGVRTKLRVPNKIRFFEQSHGFRQSKGFRIILRFFEQSHGFRTKLRVFEQS
jgi:hypothetical protein